MTDDWMDDDFDRDGHNPTVYGSKEEMKAAEKGLPFSEPEPDDGCWNCIHYFNDKCTKEWNNLDPAYYVPERDDKEPGDWCDGYSLDITARPEDYR